MKNTISLINKLILILFVSVSFSTAIQAKAKKKRAKKKVAKKSSIDFTASIEFSKLGNIFRLDDAGVIKLESNDPAYVTSKRYDSMVAVDDFVITPAVKISGPFNSATKRPLNYSLEVAYDIYTANTLGSHPEIEFELDKKLSKKMWISLETELTLFAFRKNYLSGVDTSDPAGDGANTISKEEKEYSHGIYSEFEPTLAFKFRVVEGNKKKTYAPRIDIEPFIGYHMRWFEAPLSNRDRQGITSGVNFIFEFAGKTEVELGYTFGSVTSPAEDEVDVINSTRVVHKIDRARTEHYFNAAITYQINKKIEFGVAYEMRSLEYLTDNQADEGNYQRTQTRSTFELEMEYNFSKNWSAGAAFASTSYNDVNTIETSTYSQVDITAFVQKEF